MVDPLSKRWLKQSGMVATDQGRGPVVLMYHSIEPPGIQPPSIWGVTAQNFLGQMRLLKKSGWTTLRAQDLIQRHPYPEKSVVLTFDDGFANNFDHGFKVLSDFDMKATWFMVTKDIGGTSSWSDPGQPVRAMLGKEQLLEMMASGMEIAAHSRGHLSLPDLSHHQILEEMRDSKKDLEMLLGQEVVSFAYPFGRFNEACLSAVSAAGFKIAFTTNPGWFGSDPDLFRVRRVAVFSHDTLSSFARKLAFADTEVGWRRMTRYATGRVAARFGYGE